MTRHSSGVHLVVPGLFGPMPGLDDRGLWPAVPNLERLLGRADGGTVGGTDLATTLFALFDVAMQPQRDPPSAPLCFLADTGEAAGGFWLHADPTHLRPDQDRLLLFDSRHLGLSEEEGGSLVDLFNAHFSDAGLRLQAPRADRWYLRADQPQRLSTHSLDATVGRNINSLLPRGEDARRWIGLLNEVQMLFHQSAVNRRREAAGKPAVNSLWFWGGGEMPERPGAAVFARVLADHPLARGLGAWASVPLMPGAGGEPLPPASDLVDGTLVVLQGLLLPVLDVDPVSWKQAMEALDRALMPWIEAMRRRGIATLSLYPCNGRRYVIDRRSWRRLWRRRTPLRAMLMRDG